VNPPTLLSYLKNVGKSKRINSHAIYNAAIRAFLDSSSEQDLTNNQADWLRPSVGGGYSMIRKPFFCEEDAFSL